MIFLLYNIIVFKENNTSMEESHKDTDTIVGGCTKQDQA